MSISTGMGDDGTTYLSSGEQVSKTCARVEAFGTVDELISFLTDAGHLVQQPEVADILTGLQLDLFLVAGELASSGKHSNPLDPGRTGVVTEIVNRFENEIGLTGFVVPGQTPSSARLDICRTVARRCERRILQIDDGYPVPDYLKVYLNRLSDLLFMLARFEEFKVGKIVYKK